MPRKSLEDIGPPVDAHNPGLVPTPPGRAPFEAAKDAQRRDASRSRGLIRAAEHHLSSRRNIARAQELAANLNGSGDYASRASAVWMREKRINIAGNLSAFIDKTGADQARAVSIIPADCILAPRELLGFELVKRKNALRSALVREGAAHTSGWILMAVDGCFNLDTCRWEVHFHGVVSGEMERPVRALSKRPAYASHRIGEDKIWRGVEVEHTPLKDPLRWATYCFKSELHARSNYETEEGGLRRSRYRQRLPKSQQTRALFWMDQWGINDTTLLYGFYVGRDGFELSR